jgi:hypothetical protein
MVMTGGKQYYILMADIRDSSRRPGKELMAEFSVLTQDVNRQLAGSFLSPMTITLGDEFQSVVKDLAAGLEVILALEEQLLIRQHTFKLRYVLHYGVIDTALNPEIAYGMLGDGLATARHLLDDLKGRRGERFFLQTEVPEKDAVLNKLFFLYGAIVDDWKPKDTATLSLFLQHPDYKVVADKLKKDRSLLWRKEKSLRLREYGTVKELIILTAERPG